MLNWIWLGLMAIALVVAAVTGTPDKLTTGAIDGATTAVQISLGLIGIMSLWLGVMRVAEKAGLVTLISRIIAPILRRLFPGVPSDHPAIGAIAMSLAANALGLNNAATPLGIKAMEELQTLNPRPSTATNAMVTFLAVLTAGVQLIPATAIGVLVASGSKMPTAIIGTTLVATAAGTLAGVIAALALQRFFPESASSGDGGDDA
ncbi:MAG: nucleoside recognition domain-containing protein [Thermoanaerobaculia bacterium]|jgi:spore maturation protein A